MERTNVDPEVLKMAKERKKLVNAGSINSLVCTPALVEILNYIIGCEYTHWQESDRDPLHICALAMRMRGELNDQ